MESTQQKIATTISEHLQVVNCLNEACGDVLAVLIERTEVALRAGGKICFFGNGGSASDAQHLATEFVVRYSRQRAALASIAFTTDTSALTAGGNDFGFESIFSRQVEALCGAKDVVVGISTSGTSPNVIAGLMAAKKLGALTVLFTGRPGGEAAQAAGQVDLVLAAPSEVTARIQECHLIAGHILCDLVEEAFAEQS
ncbi:MAG: SIS domain-containing protein [Verrucomicrobiales bacterium]|nr:SIS domain-containing protein [Verrucomicrobiales bacterium]